MISGCLFAHGDLVDVLNTKGDWSKEDPNASGILGCRKCSMVFKELSPEEQEYWLANKDLSNQEHLTVIQSLMVTPRMIFEVTDDNSNSGILKAAEIYRSGFVKLSKAGKRLLFHYYMDLNLDQDEVKNRLQNIYEKLYFTKAWQSYEEEVNNLYDKGEKIFKMRAFESFKPLNTSIFTKNTPASSQYQR